MARRLENLRNIGIVAHIDAGKTTLTERMLYYARAIHRMGEVDNGTTETDVDPEEQQRGITIYAACKTFHWNDYVINLIDTPGHVDFTAEVERSLRVLDGAVVVFSAREGVEAQSETVWRQADKYHVPRIAFINKMDREGADFFRTFDQIEHRLGHNPLAVQIPLGAGPPHMDSAFGGVIDLVTMRLLTFDRQSKGTKVAAGDIPAEMAETAQLWRSRMLEQLYNYSDELMELALQEAPIPEELLRQVIRQATLHRLIVPVFCGSALHYIGVQPVLDAVARYLPGPADLPAVEGVNPKKPERTERREHDPGEPFCGLVFKVLADKHGDLYMVRVYSGKLAAGTRLYNPGKDKKENAAQLWQIQPSGRGEQIKQVEAGDIVGIIGLRHTITGDTLCQTQHPVLLETIKFPETVISMAIEPETSTERKKLADVLELMTRQDPTFETRQNEETGQTLIAGMGELHLEVIKHRLLRDFNLDVKVHKPRVSYRETIEKAVAVEGECHRIIAAAQTFARLAIRMEPCPEVVQEVAVWPGAVKTVPIGFLETARDELAALAKGGGYYGYPLTKVKITVTGGAVREGESNDVAFRIAAKAAFDKGLEAGGVVLLEPIMKLEISTPDDNLGDFVSVLQQKRAIIHRTQPRGPFTVIEAEAPLAALFGFSRVAGDLGHGRATFTMEPATFGPAPPEVLEGFL